MNRPVFPLVLVAALLVGVAPPVARRAVAAQVATKFDRVKAAFPAAAARALEATVESARARGLPADPLVDKALEGAAKGIPADRVVEVVRTLAGKLERARTLLAGDAAASPADITAVADALGRGVPEAAVRSLRTAVGDEEPIALAVHTLADLLDRGVPVGTAVDVLGAWRVHGARPEELRELPAAVERLIRGGVLPAQAAAAVASAVRAGERPGAAGPPGLGSPPTVHGGSKDRPPLPPGAGPPGGPPGHQGGKGGKGKGGHGADGGI